MECYQNDKLRKHLTGMRLSSHSLEIKTGRYDSVERRKRLCKLCSQNMIGSENHCMLCCSLYQGIRLKYLGRCSWPSI